MVHCARFFLWLASPIAIFLCGAFSSQSAGIDPYLALFLGYSKAVNAVALSPDGRQAVSGGKDNLLRLWDLRTGLLLRTIDDGSNTINAAEFLPDGRRILAGGSDKTFRLWDVITGQTILSMEGHTSDILSIALSPSGQQALSGSLDKTVKLWDIETGALLKTFEGHSDGVLSVAFSADGRQALSGSKDRTIKLWDLETGRLLKRLEGHTDEVTSVALSRAGALAVSGSRDRTIKLWDVESGKPVRTFEGHSGEVLSVGFSPDAREVLSASKDNTLRIWDRGTGETLKTFEGHADMVTSVAISSDGRRAITGSWDKTLKLWDIEAGALEKTVDLQSVTFSPNGYRSFFKGASASKAVDPAELDSRLQAKGFKRGNPVFLRIFKADREVELWMKRKGRFELFAAYPICAWSGQLGPKIREGDGQAPEGFYTIGNGQLNANSLYHRAFNLGYPNLFDRAYGRTGGNLMLHGACGSVGCYAMTDALIDELWLLVTAALNGGQERIWVHAFPFRMSEERMAAFAWHPSAEFWQDLKPAYDYFEEDRIPPKISVCRKRYLVEREKSAENVATLQSSCPGIKETATQSHPGPSRQDLPALRPVRQ